MWYDFSDGNMDNPIWFDLTLGEILEVCGLWDAITDGKATIN